MACITLFDHPQMGAHRIPLGHNSNTGRPSVGGHALVPSLYSEGHGTHVDSLRSLLAGTPP
jgi:hypothetical protein